MVLLVYDPQEQILLMQEMFKKQAVILVAREKIGYRMMGLRIYWATIPCSVFFTIYGCPII